MKKWLDYILVALLCGFFLIAGSGLNVIHYCCAECHDAGVQHVASGQCDAIHHHQHKHNSNCHHHGTCHYQHLQLSDSTPANSVDFLPTLAIHDLPAIWSATGEPCCPITKQQYTYTYSTAPPSTRWTQDVLCIWVI